MHKVIFFLTLCVPVLLKDVNEVLKERNSLLENELNLMLGSDITLNDNEQKANDIVMNLKKKILDEGYHNAALFNLSRHFFDYKKVVQHLPLYKIIEDMPKGALLHAHDTGILKPDYVLALTYLDDLYVCFVEDEVYFKFSKDTPDLPCETQWQLLRDARYSSGNVKKFDASLMNHFSILVDDPDLVHPDVDTVWQIFQHYFIKTGPLFTYKPVWEQYFYDTLKALKNDGIMYAEIRSVLPPLYDLDGNVYDSVATAESYEKVLEEFITENPDFLGAKLIYAPLKKVSVEQVKLYLETAREIKRRMPDFFAGFDLVGQEDKGVPLIDFLPVLAESMDEFDYYLHAGETCWNGATDENIIDAIALGTKRLGHAYALSKHPLLIQEVKKRDIAIEVNVISNAVLGLIEDLRNHPLATYLADSLPVVIASDDPGVWDAEPITHDFFVTFVGVASKHADLRLLKKLAMNSINYSSIDKKDKALHEFEIRWTTFINRIIDNEKLYR